jgi:hypothetical protein
MNELARRYQELEAKLSEEEAAIQTELLRVLRWEYTIGEGEARPQFGPDYRLLFIEVPDDWKRKEPAKPAKKRKKSV